MYTVAPTAFLSGEVRPIPFDAFKHELLLNYDPSLRAKSTRRSMLDLLKALTALGVETTADLTVSLVAKYVASQPPHLSGQTVTGRLRYLQAVCTYAFKSGYVRISPFLIKPMRQWTRKTPSKRKQFHTPAEVGKVLEVLRHQAENATGWKQWKARRTYALAATLAYTGGRASEIYFLELEEIDLPARRLVIRNKAEHRLKTGMSSERTVVIPPALVPILTAWLCHRLDRPPGFAFDPSSKWVFPTASATRPWLSGAPGGRPRDALVAAGVAAGVAGFNPLSLRHSCATALMYGGASESVIMQQLGHTNLQTQSPYKHRQEEMLRSIVDRLVY